MAEGPTKHRVVGTAGHIDHGKTSLVRALTGVDTDRLPEERRRGITIELGFASWPLSDELHVSLVDVPGHERFVRTMVAGAAGLDAVLLVVAADDGVMPQTREHLAVCELLGVERGVVALSKADLVDEELLALAKEDVRTALKGSFLEDAPLIPCSSLSGVGIEELRAALRRVVETAPARSSAGPAFLPLDRVFTRPGFGTVVTGTLLGGQLALGDEVDVIPGPRGRALPGLVVRGLEVHGRSVERVSAGTRVALNLRGVERDEVRRGDVAVAAGSRASTSSLLAEVRLLEGAPALKDGEHIALHLGGKSVLARATLLGARRLEEGVGFVRFSAREPLAAFAEQRLVLRRPGVHGQGTVGGGRVLDPLPPTGRGAHARLRELAGVLASAGDLSERVLALLRAARVAGVSERELAERCAPGSDVEGALSGLSGAGAVLLLEGGERRWVDASLSEGVERQVLAVVDELHRERPLVLGVSASELRSRLPPPQQELVETALSRLAQAGTLLAEEGLVRRAGHRPTGAAAGALERLERVYASAGLKPPLDEEARKELRLPPKAFKDALTELKRYGRLRRLGVLHFHASALEELSRRVRGYFDERAELSAGELKQLAGGVSRKFAIPLLEWLDAEGVTRRRGDVRVRGRT